MFLTLFRFAKKEKYSVGRLFVDGKYFCDTLELPARSDGKQPGTAIPGGIYECGIIYSPHFKRNLVDIKNVPNRTDIRIHAGNTVKDTQGCPLVGINSALGTLTQSRDFEARITDIVAKALRGEDRVLITII